MCTEQELDQFCWNSACELHEERQANKRKKERGKRDFEVKDHIRHDRKKEPTKRRGIHGLRWRRRQRELEVLEALEARWAHRMGDGVPFYWDQPNETPKSYHVVSVNGTTVSYSSASNTNWRQFDDDADTTDVAFIDLSEEDTEYFADGFHITDERRDALILT